MKLKKRQNGFSLLGIFAVLMILAVLIAAVYRYQTYVSESSRASELVRAARVIKEEILKIRGIEVESNYFEYLEASGGVPKGFEPLHGVRRWETKWGTVYVGGLLSTGHRPPGFGVLDGVWFSFPRVSGDICLQVVQSLELEFDFIWWVPIGQGDGTGDVLKNHDVAFNHSNAAQVCGDSVDGRGMLRLAVYK